MHEVEIDFSGSWLNISDDVKQLILNAIASSEMFGLTTKDAGSSVIFTPASKAAIVLPRVTAPKKPYIIHFDTDLHLQRTIQLTLLAHRVFVPYNLLDVFKPLQLFISSQNKT